MWVCKHVRKTVPSTKANYIHTTSICSSEAPKWTPKTTHKELIDKAEAEIQHITAAEVAKIVSSGNPAYCLVDIRDKREIEREGKIPGAYHAPRGMLEFWVDPTSPYHKPIFQEDKTFIFYCAAGWRSALATHTVSNVIGLPKTLNMKGGFGAWKENKFPIEGAKE
eukprot:TRINITY_DN7593_c0_g1_i1.p1 TRINITY_DN7593_c0_g1~~TRINITY_DN7593_c0_g1_i1.p1  ORF type:complete len:166 (+),score=29.65 TRINITY_DN7593_c0_g1_i1:16-513(+)